MDLIPLNLFMKLLFLLVVFLILCGGLWMHNAKYNNYYYYRYSRIYEAFGFLEWNRALMKQRWLTEQMLQN